MIYLGLLPSFLLITLDDIYLMLLKENISCFVCDCMKTSSKHVITFSLKN